MQGPVDDPSSDKQNSVVVNVLAIIKAIDSGSSGRVTEPAESGLASDLQGGSLPPGLFLNADGGLPDEPPSAPAGNPLAVGLHEGAEQSIDGVRPSGVTQKLSPTGREFGADPREVVADAADAGPLGSSRSQASSDEQELFATVLSRELRGPESTPSSGLLKFLAGAREPTSSLPRVVPGDNGGGTRNSTHEPSEASALGAGPREEAAGTD